MQVERVEVPDVRVPDQLVRAMTAEAARNARAKVIAADGEHEQRLSQTHPQLFSYN